MGLVPAVLVPGSYLCPVVQQRLAAGGVAPCQHGVVQRGQAAAVFVVGRCSEGQQSLSEEIFQQLNAISCQEINFSSAALLHCEDAAASPASCLATAERVHRNPTQRDKQSITLMDLPVSRTCLSWDEPTHTQQQQAHLSSAMIALHSHKPREFK